MRLLKITGCKDSSWWYSDYVGSSFELDKIQADGSFVVLTGAMNDDGDRMKACIAAVDGKEYEKSINKLEARP